MTTTTDVLDVRAKAKRAKRRQRVLHSIYVAAGILLFLGVWLVLSVRFPLYFPSPVGAVRHLAENFMSSEWTRRWFAHVNACPGLEGSAEPVPEYCSGYVLHLLVTTRNIMIGAALGTICGLSMGLGSLVFPKIAEVFTPIASFFGTAPIFIAAPFFVIWFGVDVPLLTTVGLITFYTTLLMYFFSRRAAENIEVGIIESALTLGGTPRSIFRWVYLRGTVPEIAGGFRIALAGAWGLGVLVEVLGIQRGGGFLIAMWRFGVGLVEWPAAVVALITFFAVLAVIVDGILVQVIRFMTRWSEAGRRLEL